MDSLPPEVRCKIYAQCVNIRAFGLLYVSKQFHNEFSPFLQEDFVLGFHIDPSSSTEVKLISPDNSPWGDQWIINAASSHPDYSIIDEMPIDRFKGIRILIDPPSMDDTGQVDRGWLQSTALVTALLYDWEDPTMSPITEDDIWRPPTRLTTRLPPITIQVRDGDTVQWYSNGSWNRQVPCYTAWEPVLGTARAHENASSDLEIILTPFARLRYADAISIELPFNAPVESGFENFRSRLVSFMTRKKSFGLEVSRELGPNDNDVQAREDTLYVWLDYLLDDMHGPSAANIRRDRFKFWCLTCGLYLSHRVYGLDCNSDDVFGGARGTLRDGLLGIVENSIHERFLSTREHVLAAYRDVLRKQGQPVYIYTDRSYDFKILSSKVHQHALRPKLGNDNTFWEIYYPSGIQPKSQNDCWRNIDLSNTFLLSDTVPPYGAKKFVDTRQTFPPGFGRCKLCEPLERL